MRTKISLLGTQKRQRKDLRADKLGKLVDTIETAVAEIREFYEANQEDRSISIPCQPLWVLNGIAYNNCTNTAVPGMCFCATKVDNMTKQLIRWKYCLRGECIY